jgi:hypothetical protein
MVGDRKEMDLFMQGQTGFTPVKTGALKFPAPKGINAFGAGFQRASVGGSYPHRSRVLESFWVQGMRET